MVIEVLSLIISVIGVFFSILSYFTGKQNNTITYMPKPVNIVNISIQNKQELNNGLDGLITLVIIAIFLLLSYRLYTDHYILIILLSSIILFGGSLLVLFAIRKISGARKYNTDLLCFIIISILSLATIVCNCSNIFPRNISIDLFRAFSTGLLILNMIIYSLYVLFVLEDMNGKSNKTPKIITGAIASFFVLICSTGIVFTFISHLIPF